MQSLRIMVLSSLLVVLLGAGAKARPVGQPEDKLLDAIRLVETGGCRDPLHAVGDGGLALGPYQIHLNYLKDAGHDAADYRTVCTNHLKSRECVRRYWKRYNAMNDRERCLLHHYGITHCRKTGWSDPHKYYIKVLKHVKF